MIDTQLALERYVRLKDEYYRRNDQIARWRDMYFLRWTVSGPDEQELDFEYITDNLPHEKIELAVDTLCGQDPIVEVPLSETPDPDRSTMSNEKRIKKEKTIRAKAEGLERFLHGYWERLEAEEAQNTWRMLVLDLVATGYSVARVLWDDEREDGQLPIIIQHIKPETFFPLKGRRGHTAQICAWKRPKADVEQEWGITLNPTAGSAEEDKTAIEVEFVDYWEKTVQDGKPQIWHAVFADSTLVFGPVKTSYRDLPYVQVMAKPTDSEDTANEALPFIFGYKDLWEVSNKHLSDFRDLLRKYVNPATIVRTAGGSKPPDFTLERGAISYLNRDLDEDARYLQWDGTPPDFQRFTTQLQMMADRVGFNTQYLVGSPGQTESGWHWTQSTSTQKIKLRPYRRAAEWLRQQINRHLLRRLEEHADEIKVLQVYGTDKADKRYVAELDTRKINGEYTNLIRINDHVPYDDIQKAQLIRTYREAVNGTPFLSDRFLRTSVAQVPYNEEIEQQIADQQLAFHQQMLEFMVERGIAQQMIKLRQENPALAGAVREVQARAQPRPQMPPPQMMGQPPSPMGGPGAMMQNAPAMPPGVGLQPPPGAAPMGPAAPPVGLGQVGPSVMPPQISPPPMMRPFGGP